MPETIGAILIATFSSLTAAEAVAVGFTIAGVTITYASIIGAAVLAAASFIIGSALSPGSSGQAGGVQPAANGQLAIQQPIPFRRRGYGRMKLGGFYIFWTSLQGAMYQLYAILAHEIDAFEEYWVSDRKVALDGSGYVTSVTAPPAADSTQFNPGGKLLVQIVSSRGEPGKVAYPELTTPFAGIWTADHIGVGICDALMILNGVPQQDFSKVYPGGIQTLRCLLRGAKVYDPRDMAQVEDDPATWEWSDNWAVVVLDYLTHADGWRIDKSVFLTGMARDLTIAAMDVSDELVPLKTGGTEKRYRLWGYYDFSEEPRNVLARFLAAGAGWLQPMPDGTIAINAGQWIDPDVTIVDSWILGFEIQHFTGEFDTVNEIRGTFIDVHNDYQDSEAFPWRNEEDIAARGYVKSTTIDARHAPSFTQCRRLQKIAYSEAAPEFSINVTLTADALAARNRRFVNLDMEQLGLGGTFRVTGYTANTGSGVVNMSLAAFGPDAYSWDPDTDEGDPPPIPADSANENSVETPTGLTVSVETRTITGESVGPVMVIFCDPPVYREDLNVKFEYQVDGSDSWTLLSDGTQTYQTETSILADGIYNVRVSFITPNSNQSLFDEVDGVVVSASVAAPSAPTGLSLAHLSPGVEVDFTGPNSPTFAAARVWRNNVATFGTATDVSGPLYGSPNQVFAFDNHPSAGTWYYWVTAESSTGAASSPTGPQSITV